MAKPPTATGLVVLVLIAGCGGSSAPSASDAAFHAKAQALCRTIVAEGPPATTSPAGIGTYQDHLAAWLTGIRARLAAIGPPAAKRAAFDKLLASFHNLAQLIRRFRALGAGAQEGQRKVLARELNAASASGDQAAEELGIRCTKRLKAQR